MNILYLLLNVIVYNDYIYILYYILIREILLLLLSLSLNVYTEIKRKRLQLFFNYFTIVIKINYLTFIVSVFLFSVDNRLERPLLSAPQSKQR